MARQYSDEFRASAVVLLEAAGFPDKRGALQTVARRIGVPQRTLGRWARGQSNPPPAQLVAEKRDELAGAIRNELSEILAQMGQVRGGADYRDLALAAGILFDKLHLLGDDTTETVRQDVVLRAGDFAPDLDK